MAGPHLSRRLLKNCTTHNHYACISHYCARRACARHLSTGAANSQASGTATGRRAAAHVGRRRGAAKRGKAPQQSEKRAIFSRRHRSALDASFLGFYSRIFDHGCRDSKSSTPSARGPNPERCARLRRRRQRSVVPPPPAAACLSASRAPGSSYRVFKRPEARRLVGTRRGAAGLSARFENDTVDLARTPKKLRCDCQCLCRVMGAVKVQNNSQSVHLVAAECAY